MSGERILVMAHGHPDMIRGGGEIAAHNMFKSYRDAPSVEAAWFLARADFERGATGRIRRHRPGEYLWEQGHRNAFLMGATNLHEITGYFAELIRALRPTVIHTHHFFNLGLEYLKVIKDIDPSIRLVLTLHEYIAICPNAGLMLKPGTTDLCRSGHYADHAACAPDKSPEDLWLRKHRFDCYFAHVDHFVAPSQFLRDRYIEWGIAPDRISVLRNGQPDHAPLAPRPLNAGEGRNRFAYFGQINPYKGLDVLLKGLSHLTAEERRDLVLEVHGANLELQSKSFRKTVRTLAKPLIAEGTVQWRGSYAPDELAARMADVDWVLVPSIWYENAPLVIQEAFAHGRPVIVSDLGGMKEAVRDGIDGLRLPRANSPQWARTMLRLSRETETWDAMHDAIIKPVTLPQTAKDHLDLFSTLQLEPA